jgi:hypothetical protein
MLANVGKKNFQENREFTTKWEYLFQIFFHKMAKILPKKTQTQKPNMKM